MPNSVTLKQVSYSTPDNQPVLSDLDLAFGPRRTGLIGRNGTGKSTLLRLITGELTPSAGSIHIEGTIGVLRQILQVDASKTVADGLGVRDALERLDRVTRGLGTVEDVENADWTLPARVEQALADAGLPPLDPARPLTTLSGGQRTRLALAALVVGNPDVILLDEPTNNLDADGRATVAALLRRWRKAAIVVSHDRALLREMDAIVELTSLGARTYGGNWDHYAERKAIELEAAERELTTAERNVAAVDKKIQQITERKARRDGTGARKAARGGIPRIMIGGMRENAENTSGGNARLATRMRTEATETLAEARAEVEILAPLTVSLEPTALPAGRTVLQCDRLSGGPVADAPILRDVSFAMIGPERVAITGPNGSGKTTLLRLLTGELQPRSGSARILVPYALLDQTVSVFDPGLTIVDNFRTLNPDVDTNACRAALARFKFRADAALQKAGTLSGGELLRAALAATIGGATPPQLLILDEPTNHLDIEAIEAVEAGLRAYDGALLVVSHDVPFLESIGIERSLELGT